MKKQIHINTEEIVNMSSLYSFFERELARDFAHNLDALADVLSDEEDVIVAIDDSTRFRAIFDQKMTEKYFARRYTEDMGTLAEMLLEIFDPYSEQI